ncbi:DUF3299 domain-containing protein [Inhella sp.]|uniref:DUF3299 domain-containing protein n=1 Tax=Inhella sp. TaxID=1921806 RepID=UPI0035B09288
MSIDFPLRTLLLAALAAASLAVAAQPRTNAAAAAPFVGQGPGYHDPRSPFKPLEDKEGVLSWSLLSGVTTKIEKKKVVPTFPAAVQALHQQKVRVQGFMMPLEPGDKQKHFLLSSVPTTCNFCVPAGPEGLIEVRSTVAVRYTLEPVVMEGLLAVLKDDPYGLFYRVVEAQPVN